MLSIKSLFEETRYDDHENLSDHLEKLNCEIDDIPILHPPIEGSKEHLRDLNAVKHSIINPAFAPKFLEMSDKKAEKVFKLYAKESGLKFEEQKIKNLCKEFDKIVMYLKNFYGRPRPKQSFQVYFDDFDCQKIRDNKSLSYPSGHTAMAYFVANIVAEDNPNFRDDLETIAAMIGQSRIDNGVHYPTDVEFGRLVGEIVSQNLINGKKKMKKLDEREVCDYFKAKAHDNKDYVSSLADFIHRSNQIERYCLDFNDCLNAADLFLKGYPVSYCTDNKYIRSHLSALRESAAQGKIDNINKIISIHKSLGDDVIENDLGAGSLRNFVHSSRSGVKYPNPDQIVSCLENFASDQIEPWQQHVLYEWIHPFVDGNGRSGRIILANSLDYDFDKVMSLIGDDYLPRIIDGTGKIASKYFS